MADKDFKVKTGLDLPAPLPVEQGGTGQTSSANVLNAILPLQTDNAGKFLQTDGSGSVSWVTAAVANNATFTGSSMVIPSGGNSSRPVSPQVGAIRLNTDQGTLEFWTGSSWGAIATFPQPPRNLVATDIGTSRSFNNASITVSFDLPVGNGGSTITSYKITSSPGSFVQTVNVPSTTATFTGLSSNKSYTFTGTSLNTIGEGGTSSASSSVLATTIPQAPTIGTVSVLSTTSVSIPFTAPSANGGKSIGGYTITSSPSISLSYNTSQTTSPIAVSATFVSGQNYTFTIAANNGNGNSAPSSSSNAVAPLVGAIASWTLNQTVPFPSGVTQWRYQHMGYTKSANNYQYYIAGGIPNNTAYNTTANSATSSWNTISSIPSSSTTNGGSNVSAANYNGRFHIFEGTNHWSIGYGQTSWSTQASIPAAYSNGNGGATSNGVYLLRGNASNSFYRWVSNSWTTLAVYPTVITGPLTSAGNGIFLSAGGSTVGGVIATKTQAAYAYNESNNTWSAVANYPILNGWSNTSNNYVTQNTSGATVNRHYIGNGTGSGNGGVADIHSYDQVSNTWRTENSSPQGNRGVNTFYNDVAKVMVHFGGDAWNNDIPRYLWTANIT